MKLDLLAFGAHPDDVELSCAGTIIKHISQGKKVGLIDLTRGELGTRGTPEIRQQEATSDGKIMGISARENLGMADGFFQNDVANQMKVITMIRKYQPEIVLANAVSDRHPDHGRGAALVRDACFYSGLKKIETKDGGNAQEPWRPRALYHYIQDHWHDPEVLIDISDCWDRRMEAVYAFKSQFYDPNSKEASTYISQPEFLDTLKFRAQTLGKMIGVQYAEGFNTVRKTGVNSLFDLR